MFNNASNTDARHSTFSEVHRDQFNALRLSTLRKQNVRYSAIVHGDQIFQLQATNTDRSTLTEYLLGTALIDVRCDGQNVCLDGTRVSLLSEIKNWADNSDPHSSRIFWLHGVAGTGKSTIANTIAHYYTTGRLGASFQFKRKVEGLNKPTSLFGHIAYQLANSNAKFMTHCLEAIRQYGRMNAFSLKEQLDRYIIVPLRQMESLSVILIVIDAIDECSDVGDRRGVLEAVMGVLPAFPACAKLLIASRYEPDIRAQLGTHCLSKSINDIHDTAGDISLYISARMVKIIQHHPHLHMHWPGEKMKEELVRLAEGLFIWASVACDHIQNSSDPMVPLWYLTSREGARPSSGGERALDALYMSILNQASSGLSSSDLRFVIGAIVTAKTSLTPQELDLLLGLNRSVLGHPIWLQDGSRIELTTSASVIAALGSMLRIDDGYIRVLHTSIFDFFTSPTRCTDPRFHINTTLFSHFLAARCFRSMCALKRDVCDINDPTQMNSDIVGLDQRLKEKMPEHIRYSCSYWHLHLADVPGVHLGLYEEAKTFLFTHLLHWFEVMSLRGDVDGIFIALNRVKPWFQRHPASDEVLQLCDDAIRFLQQFHVVMRQSASHIYISALPFTSQKSSIFRSFAHTLERVPKMLMSHRTSVEPLTTFSIRLVGSIKVAPNGSCLTYAHDGKTLQIWDADTCSPIGEPLVGHQSAIHRVYFSLDDPLVASSDEQGVTFVWDIERYVAVGGPFQRSDDVEEVIEISLVDGHVIVLFRYYNHVMVWNYITGEPAASYETGGVASLHGAYVLVSNEEHASFLDTSDFDPQSILYAPTGKDTTPAFVRMRASGNITFPVHDQLRRVMCWSSDSEIQLVDIATGGPIGDPISIPDHNNWHFSPCGRWIATHWNHIRIHSTRTGEFLFSSSGEFAQHASRWSIDGAHLLIRCGYSTTMPQFEVWDMEAMEPVGTLQLPSGHEIIAASSQRIVTINARHVAVWDVALLTNLDSQIRPPITRFIPSSTGQHILANSAAGKIECFHIGRRSYHIPHAHFPASFSPDGSLVATASWPSGDNLDILIVDAASGELRQRLREGGVATATLSFSPGNEYMIATSNDGSPKLWDIATGRLHRLGQLWAQFSRGGAQVTCVSKSGFVQTLDYRTGEVTNTPDLDSLAGPVDTVVFSPDGDTFAVIHLVNSITIRAHGQSDFTLVCPTVQYSAITSLVFSGDGMRLASSSHNLVCMWDLQRRCLVWDRRLPVSLPVNAVTLGRMHLLSLSHDETILHVLAADTGLLLSSHSLPIYRNAGIKSVALSWDETQAVLFSANIGGEMVELSSGMMSYFSSELPSSHQLVSNIYLRPPYSLFSRWRDGYLHQPMSRIYPG
ncbi:YVTN repeat-like/Quino protein amine dehydrogenase [Leucogyrophana mollusca]|uniref:YVTN repeat-like/Quino protein amine dehydrogenase n=1 Tax=Leucogyrophana mollusca TaxID=85980 RepID=A0ACB8B1B1_9AGAM|nr:YVTN repeat-like/Quino protein amine dehydrogenase [Leucogyrophana mollusca]